jgi:hypothetical protein
MNEAKHFLSMILIFVAIMTFIIKCTEVEINRVNNKKPMIIYKTQ